MVPLFGAAKQTEGVTTLAFFTVPDATTQFHCEVCLLGAARCESAREVFHPQ